MPTHVYTAGRRPPSLMDHLRAHPYQIVLSTYAMIGGALAVISAFTEGLTVSPSLDQLPTILAALVGVAFLAGGAAILHGLLDNDENLARSFKRERQGLVLQTGGWLIYGLAIIFLPGGAFLSWFLCLCLAAANAIRFEATLRQETNFRAAMTRLSGTDG